MTFNDLQDLPESITQLQKLHFLSIAYNRKFRLKENLAILKQLKGLRVLDITGIENAMEYAPILIEELPQLDKIISGNRGRNKIRITAGDVCRNLSEFNFSFLLYDTHSTSTNL